MTRTLTNDDKGNINFDFLVGLVVFMVAFLYIFNAVPGIFAPYQTNAIDLSSLAYRTSAILAEDQGWWQIDNTHYYTDWETGDHRNYMTRIGLCVDKRIPNVLSYNKILALNELIAGDEYQETRKKLGLIGTQSYNYTLQIWQLPAEDTPVKLQAGDPTLMNISNPIKTDSIESIDRMVLIRYGEGLYFDCYKTPSDEKSASGNLTLVKSPCFSAGNVSIRVTNFNGTAYNNSLSIAYNMDPDPGNPDSLLDANYGNNSDPVNHPEWNLQYYIYKTNEFERYSYVEYPLEEMYNNTDIIDIVVDGTKLNNTAAGFSATITAIVLKYCPGDVTSFLPMGLNEYVYDNPDYRYFDYPGIMRLRVWNA